MRTLSLKDAAKFLYMHPESLRKKVKDGEIPGTKPGKCWVFVDIHLAEWLRNHYAQEAQQAPRFTGGRLCQSTNVAKYGGRALQHPTVSEYASLLGLPIEKLPKSTMTG